MFSAIAAFAAFILGLKKWQPDYDRLITETEWQGGPQKAWIPYYKPITHNYEPDHIGNELVIVAIALFVAWWGWQNRHHKVDRIFARIMCGLALATALYFPLLWAARQHVEGDWKALPPRLMRSEVDTPEFLAEQAARNEYFKQEEYKRLGLTPTGEKIWHKVCIYY